MFNIGRGDKSMQTDVKTKEMVMQLGTFSHKYPILQPNEIAIFEGRSMVEGTIKDIIVMKNESIKILDVYLGINEINVKDHPTIKVGQTIMVSIKNEGIDEEEINMVCILNTNEDNYSETF